MFSAILLAGRSVDMDFASGLERHWQSRERNWLCPDKAVELSLPALPTDYAAMRDRAQSAAMDLVVIPSEGRRKRLLVADMDSTIIGQECIDQLAMAVGIGDTVAAITARAMNGEIDFSEALKQRVRLLKGMPADMLDRVWLDRISVNAGAAELVATMRGAGAEAVLISGGFTSFTGRVAERLGFSGHFANELIIEDGRLTGEVRQPVLSRTSKLSILSDLIAERGLSLSDVIAVGDGSNDIPMLNAAGIGVAYHAKPTVYRHIQTQIHHSDLTALLYIQGYQAGDVS
ncbi:MAG: phosphoserine phosphatase SerB [Rhodobacteraceae bacterium]|nr:phosphoserine phosphatase SerB [Paracoccaceae bacterium]